MMEENIIMAKKETVEEKRFNPLLSALKENDKKNLFKTNLITAFHKTGFHLYDYYLGSLVNIHDKKGNFLRQEPRVGQAAGTFNMFVGGSGSGKALPNNTMIPTPMVDGLGYIKMGDIAVGDIVFGDDGRPTEVIGVYPQGKKKCYKMYFHDGRTAISSEDHLWNVIGAEKKQYTFDTKKIYDLVTNHKRCIIPVTSAPVQYKQSQTGIRPYTLGAFMALGQSIFTQEYLQIDSLNTSCNITTIANYIAHIQSLEFDYSSSNAFIFHYHPDGKKRVSTKEFFRYLRYQYPGNDKFIGIPSKYKYNAVEDRRAFIRGVFDVRGKINDRNLVELEIPEGEYWDAFFRDFKEMIYSMGLLAKVEHGDVKRLVVQIPSNRLAEYFFVNQLYVDTRDQGELVNDIIGLQIISMEELPEEMECTCIKVANKSELFLTEDYIVTHNTTLAVQIAANIIRQYKTSTVIHFDCEQRIDLSRIQVISKLPAYYFMEDDGPARYTIKAGAVGLDTMQETIVRLFAAKMKMKNEITVDLGTVDEFGNPVRIMEPTVIIIDSITSVLSETFSPDNAKEVSEAEKLRGNTEGARDSKSLKGFFKDVLPLCKEANIIIFAINHINMNMSMNAFTPVAKKQNYLKQDEVIPGGVSLIYYPFNIVKLIAKPSDDFTKEGDGFDGHMVMAEPIKSSSNQSGNNSKGVSFSLCFSYKTGFDPLRSLIIYGRERGIIEGNRNRLKFKDDPEHTFSFKTIYPDIDEKPFIMENIKKFIFPALKDHLSYVEPNDVKFHNELMEY
jgi:snf2/rad54 helicase (fragment)